MKMNSLFYDLKSHMIYRVLNSKNDKAFVINCTTRHMPFWTELSFILNLNPITEDELLNITNTELEELKMPSKEYKYAQEHFSLIVNILPVIENKNERNKMIQYISETKNYSKQTVRKILCTYLIFQNIAALAPKKSIEKELSSDEKNMRWALNKFFYTKNKNTLSTAYMMMLKEKYTDENNQLLPHPSIYQFRYFYRKTKKLQTYYISRNGIKDYQKNHRPLLGEGVRSIANNIGTAMLDSTICDIYLINDRGEIIGRPIMTACIDVYSGMCCGYSLGWEGGMYSLRSLMINIVENKKEYCKKFGIEISEEDWNCNQLPGTLITDKGSEYASENFEQLTDLGISIINLPAFRPELKGPVEKFFDIIQRLYKPQLLGKGIIEDDFQQRGAHDYRRDACLTLDQFEKIILNCIIYYNTKRVIENFPFTDEMIKNVSPYSNQIWNYNLANSNVNLIPVSIKNLILCLLPRTNGKFTRSGLKVHQLRYKHNNYVEEYLNGKDVIVAYDPEDVSNIWLIENGCYVKFDLIDSRFFGKNLSSVEGFLKSSKVFIEKEKEESLQAQISLSKNIDTIISNKKINNNDIKNIRKTRIREQTTSHKNFMKEYDLI